MNPGQKHKMIVSSLFLTISAGFSVIPFYFIYLILVRLATFSTDYMEYLPDIVCILISYFLAYLFLFIGYHVSHILAYEVLYDVREDLARRMIHFPLGFFIDTRTGDLQTILDENVEKLELFLAHHFPEMVSLIIVPIALVIMIIIIHPVMGLVIAITLAISLFIVAYARRDFAPVMRKLLENQARLHAAILEHLQGIKVIRSFSLSSISSTRFRKEMEKYRKTAVTWNNILAPPLSTYQAIITSMLVIIVPVGGYLFLTGEMTTPIFFFFLIAGTLFGRLLLRIYTILRYLNEEFESMERISRIRETPQLSESENGISPDSFSIMFDKVQFGYGDAEVLHKISFTIPEGTTTALVGPSGSGKTTIARLIPRFYDLSGGKILIGGVDIRSIPGSTLMSLISVVFQEVYLFQGTILDNIRLGKLDASEDEVIKAAQAARCDEFIQTLPEGYQTLVGDRGLRLSGGERQRISIARSLLKNAPILIMDEATAFVDPENEIIMQEALSHLTTGKTILVIAHRLNIIKEVDQILYLDSGMIREQGTFNNLLREEGYFSRMWDRFEKTLVWKIGGES